MLTDAVSDCIQGPDSSPSLHPFSLSRFLFCVVVVSVSWPSSPLLDLELSHATHFGQQNEVEVTVSQLLTLLKHRPQEPWSFQWLSCFCLCREKNMPKLVLRSQEKDQRRGTELPQLSFLSQTQSKRSQGAPRRPA